MGRTLGFDGSSCKDAIRDVVATQGVIAFSALEHELHDRGSWSSDNIAHDVIAATVNLPPARRRYRAVPFLFVRPDGRFELFNPLIHPGTVD